MKRTITFVVAIAALFAPLNLSAQRRINPINNAATATQSVNENRTENDSIDRSRLVEMTDAKGNVVMVDTITGKEFVDTVKIAEAKASKMKRPLLHTASVSVDIFPALLRAFGQKHGLVEFAAEINLYNRFIPVVEVGLGQANNTPEGNNYTYRSPVSPYFRIGMNYNFMFKSDPDYLIMAGVRYGISPFSFSVTNVTQDGGYWDQPLEYDIPSQHVTAGYVQALVGLRVKVWKSLYMGWSVNFHKLLHESKTTYGQPWYIPGLGTRNSSLGAAFSITYTIPLSKKESPNIETEGSDVAPTPDGSSDLDATPAAEDASTPAAIPTVESTPTAAAAGFESTSVNL